MARILISYFSDYGEVMYDSISSVLLKNGNDVFRLNINSYSITTSDWGGKNKLVDERLQKNIKAFDPEIILNFNHSYPPNAYIGANCKNCILDADNPETFWNQEYLYRNWEQYYFLGFQKYSQEMYRNFINPNITEGKNYSFTPPATAMQNIAMKQDKNISFIGSNFYPLAVPYTSGFYDKIGLQLYHKFRKDYFYPYQSAYKLIGNYNTNKEILFEYVRGYYVGQERLKYMQQISDLGFTYYGLKYWKKIAYYDFELADCFDATPQTSLEDNRWVYNTSKISINLSHPQAKTSFSWRVMDIMASNACLLMEDKPDWHELFGHYISDKVKQAIIYHDRFDMREKAKRLLQDNKLRQQCVAECNNAIEQNGRWEQRFKKLEEFLSTPLLNIKNPNPTYIRIKRHRKNTYDKRDTNNTRISAQLRHSKLFTFLFQHFKQSKRLKSVFCATIILAAQIPVLNLLIKQESVYKYVDKLKQYWE